LPFATGDYRTRQVALSEGNFNPALASQLLDSLVLRAIQDIPGAPKGAYWDGGITDYHLHLNYPGAGHTQGAINSGAARAHSTGASGQMDAPRLVLYPHFQKSVVPRLAGQRLEVAAPRQPVSGHHGRTGTQPGLGENFTEQQTTGPHRLYALRQ